MSVESLSPSEIHFKTRFRSIDSLTSTMSSDTKGRNHHSHSHFHCTKPAILHCQSQVFFPIRRKKRSQPSRRKITFHKRPSFGQVKNKMKSTQNELEKVKKECKIKDTQILELLTQLDKYQHLVQKQQKCIEGL